MYNILLLMSFFTLNQVVLWLESLSVGVEVGCWGWSRVLGLK